MEDIKRKHHYVFEGYLRPWSDNGMTWRLWRGKVARKGLSECTSAAYFYKVHLMNGDEYAFLRKFIELFPEVARQTHYDSLNFFRLLSMAKQAMDNPNPALLAMPDFKEKKAYIEMQVHNFEENMHKHREDRLLPFIRRMLNGDMSFYDDMNDMVTFMDSLSAQYFRTKVTPS